MFCGTLKVLLLKSFFFDDRDVFATKYANFIAEIFNTSTEESLKCLDSEARADLHRAFRKKQRTSNIHLNRPPLECERGRTQLQLERSGYSNKVSFIGQKIKVSPEVWNDWFLQIIESAIAVTKETLQDNGIFEVKSVLLFGEFCNYYFAVDMLMKQFPNVIIPNDVEVAKIRGACFYGHQPDILQSRIVESVRNFLTKEVQNEFLFSFKVFIFTWNNSIKKIFICKTVNINVFQKF